jgi:hypothetical protein
MVHTKAGMLSFLVAFLFANLFTAVDCGGQSPAPKIAKAVNATDIPKPGVLGRLSKPTPEILASAAPSLTLAPAVIMVNAQPTQSTTQKMSITNLTPSQFEFRLEAMDVVVREGKRVFVRAGELPGSIARTAVFSPSELVLLPGKSATVNVTVTVPENPASRAIVAIFRSRTTMRGGDGVAMSASLGTLLTFTLSKKFQIDSAGLQFEGPPSGDDLQVSEWITNTGSEPVIPKGVIALLNSSGTLVAKIPLDAKRLLPGERLQFTAQYPSTVKAGDYRALVSLEYEGGLLTNSSKFKIK